MDILSIVRLILSIICLALAIISLVISNKEYKKAYKKMEKIKEIMKFYEGAYPEDFWHLIRDVINDTETNER